MIFIYIEKNVLFIFSTQVIVVTRPVSLSTL